MDKTDTIKRLVAEISKEIVEAEPIADDQLDRSIVRTKALLRSLNEERELREAKQARRSKKVAHAREEQHEALTSPAEGVQPKRIPKRDAIVMALEKMGVASSPARISALVREAYQLRVSTSQFASFRKADERSFRQNPRSRTYIVPALSAADFSGMVGMVALSSWPIERRVIGGFSQRVDALRALCAAYDNLKKTNDPAYAAIIEIIGREFPSIGKHAPHLAQMVKAAAADLARLEAEDEEERKRAAERISRLDIVTQLFGKVPLVAVRS